MNKVIKSPLTNEVTCYIS